MATTINFSAALLDGDNNPVTPPTTLGKLLSDMMLGASINDEPTKYFDWALDLRQSGILVLDDTDKERISNFIKASSAITILGKGRLLKALSGVAPAPPMQIVEDIPAQEEAPIPTE